MCEALWSRLRPLVILISFAAVTPAASAQDPATDASTDGEVRALVVQLGDAQFEVRERATIRLSRIGLPARDALVAALKHPDAEVRGRSRRILAGVLEADYHHRVDLFAAGGTGPDVEGLPCWSQFRSQIGAEPEARELFVAMLRAEPELMETAQHAPGMLTGLIRQRTQTLKEMLYGSDPQQRQPLTLGTVAALYFVASRDEVAVDEQIASSLYSFSHQSAFQQAARSEDPQSKPLRKLLGNWVSRDGGGGTSYHDMILSLNHDLKQGLDPAVKTLKEGGGSRPHARQYAILLVGKYGNQKHQKLVSDFLDDQAVCGAYRVNEQQINSQVRDVALAVLIHLNGQNHKDYGFDHLQKNPQYLFSPGTLGFAEDAQREAALKKWKQHSTAQAAAGTMP
jgi:hypothetical protein